MNTTEKKEKIEIQEISSPILYTFFVILFLLSFVIGLIFLIIFCVIIMYPMTEYLLDPLSEPVLRTVVYPVMFPSLLIAIMSAIFLIVHPKGRYVLPLLPVWKGGFILCEEGVYALQIKRRNYLYFYPWDSLRLYKVDEKKMVIGLKSKKKLIKLKAKENFGELKSIILRYIPTKEEIAKGKEKKFRTDVLMVILCIYALVWIFGASYYEHISVGEVGDGRCDICGRTPIFEHGYKIYEGDKPIHEYCLDHGLIYFFIHPKVIINTIITEEEISEYLLLLGLFIWWYAILLHLATILSLSQWHKAKILRQ